MSAATLVIFNADPVAAAYLIGCHQTRHGLHQQPLYRALQVPCAVLDVRAFLEQKALARIGQSENKCPIRGRVKDTLLNRIQLDIQNLLQLFTSKWLECNDLVQPVDKLRSGFSASCFDTGACEFLA